jgi:hypothetical protein
MQYLATVSINYWAVLVCTAASMLIGYIWYSKPLFGNVWAKLTGMTEEKAKKGFAKAIIGMVLAALLLSHIMSHFIDYVGANTAALGATTGFWAWLGFVVTTKGADYLFSHKPLKLYALDIGYHLIEFVAIGTILAVWQ